MIIVIFLRTLDRYNNYQKPMSRSEQQTYIPVTALIYTDRLFYFKMGLPQEPDDQSHEANLMS